MCICLYPTLSSFSRLSLYFRLVFMSVEYLHFPSLRAVDDTVAWYWVELSYVDLWGHTQREGGRGGGTVRQTDRHTEGGRGEGAVRQTDRHTEGGREGGDSETGKQREGGRGEGTVRQTHMYRQKCGGWEGQ